MRGLSLQRVSWRRALRHPGLHPRSTSRWATTCTDRKRRAEETRIESLTAKWQPHWDKLSPQWHELRKSDRGNAYVLPMFPYPSGTLHLGHLRVYTISDVLARFKHMQGYKVLHPIGWDAFGLPAENAAIERGVHPETWTLQNIEAMKGQMKEMGGRWDWDAEIQTCDPHFYKHTQRIFLMLHERGLAYQAESLVNYDPVDRTVLANEQVDASGRSWRSGAQVEKVMLKQWFLKIKAFQEPLLKDLDALAGNGRWPEKVLAMQRNWIGKSEGTKLCFDIESASSDVHFEPVDVFTTRADTLFGVQYIALSLRHPIVQQLAVKDESLQAFIEQAKELPPDTKEGYLLPNIVARNPIADSNDANPSPVSIYVAPYVLDDYGSGAVMGVPGHDTRDHAFWRTNAGEQPIKVVISSKQGVAPSTLEPGTGEDVPMTEKGFVATNIARFGDMTSEQAAGKIVDAIRSSGKQAEKTATWRLRDWLISRQRYWGTPIPIIHCYSCGPVPVPEKDLPVKLPNLPDSFFDGRKGNPLAEDEHWKKTTCPKCGSAAERETDTMDTFMDSSWYFFRFLDPKNENALVDPVKTNSGMPVDLYVGGVEHAILHLLYARFISKFLATTSTWPKGYLTNGEPFTRLITQGMVHGETFTDPDNGRFLRPDEVDLTNRSKPLVKATGLAPNVSYEKMSKSKYNGVDPGATIARHGADATRAHMLFQAPVGDVLEWDEKKITGVQRWLQRVVRLSTASWIPDDEVENFVVPTQIDAKLLSILQDLPSKEVLTAAQSSEIASSLSPVTRESLISSLKPEEAKLWIKTQQTTASVTESYSQTYSLNTIVSDLMTLTNTIWDTPHASPITPYLKWHSTAHLIRMLAPITPGVAEEAWHLLTTCTSNHPIEDSLPNPNPPYTVFATGFPIADLDIITLLTHTRKCVVQVDGKRKFDVEIPKLPDTMNTKDSKAVAKWMLGELVKTEEGREWLDRETGKIWKADKTGQVSEVFGMVPQGWKVIVVGGGKLCNFVGPRKGKSG
ncbi:leucyl-tRNA synthetase [Clathrospora elynae]|uniref:leucine--tRNA ligase n=1 Tax=Clathrospora elynae TaxID=706981 RepID=A0A6A5SB85_9PLEO|nr:leucyl-tRNA synthetase [Clathrospora elynae]